MRARVTRDDEDVSVAQRSYPHHLTERVRWSWPQGGMPLPRNLESLLDVAEAQAVPGVGPVLYPGQELA